MYCVYFLKSLKNNKIYVGFTTKDPKIRVKEHNESSNTWSKQNKPLRLIYFETYACELDARKREKFYKIGIGKKIKIAICNSMEL